MDNTDVEVGQRAEEAVADFRKALFLDGSDLEARFWYATALQRAGAVERARSEVEQLAAQLERLAANSVLADGRTAAELNLAVELMRVSMS